MYGPFSESIQIEIIPPPPLFFLLAFLFIKDQSRKPSNEIVQAKKKFDMITSQEESEKNLKLRETVTDTVGAILKDH